MRLPVADVFLAFDDGLNDRTQLIAQEDRDDGRRRFVRAQAVVVACGGYRHAQQFLIFIHRFDDGGEEHEEAQVV